MKKLNKRITYITNAVLAILFAAVFIVSFVPDPAVMVTGGTKTDVIYRGNTQNKNVSLMFNVYENTQTVNKIIDVLQEKKVTATFFVGGCWADDNAETLNRMVANGNEIGNHGYFHKDHAKLSFENNKKEIELCGTIVKALCGENMNLFAPPSGSFSEDTLAAASDLGYKVIMWSKDTIDWRDKDQSTIFKRATKDLSNGDLILMHPKDHTLAVLPKIIDYCLSLGYNVVPVSQNVV